MTTTTTSRARRRQGGLTVLWQSMQEAVLWALVAHVIFNTWHEIVPTVAWPYGYSATGLVSFLIDQIVPSQWVPLLVGCILLVGVVFLAFKFLPLITAAWHRPVHAFLTAAATFLLTIGLFEAIYYGFTNGQLYWSPHLIYNAIPPLVVATIVIAGRGSKVYYYETGARDVVDVDTGTEVLADDR